MIKTKARTELVLNEGTKIRIKDNYFDTKVMILDAQECRGNYVELMQVYFFGLRRRCIRLNCKRILFFYGIEK